MMLTILIWVSSIIWISICAKNFFLLLKKDVLLICSLFVMKICIMMYLRKRSLMEYNFRDCQENMTKMLSLVNIPKKCMNYSVRGILKFIYRVFLKIRKTSFLKILLTWRKKWMVKTLYKCFILFVKTTKSIKRRKELKA